MDRESQGKFSQARWINQILRANSQHSQILVKLALFNYALDHDRPFILAITVFASEVE